MNQRTVMATDFCSSNVVKIKSIRCCTSTLGCLTTTPGATRTKPVGTRVMHLGVRRTAAGLVFNQHANIARDEYDRLKATLPNCVRQGPASRNRDARPDFRAYLEGRVRFVESVNPVRGDRLRGLLQQIVWPADSRTGRRMGWLEGLAATDTVCTARFS